MKRVLCLSLRGKMREISILLKGVTMWIHEYRLNNGIFKKYQSYKVLDIDDAISKLEILVELFPNSKFGIE
jgi:hypothetical protein